MTDDPTVACLVLAVALALLALGALMGNDERRDARRRNRRG